MKKKVRTFFKKYIYFCFTLQANVDFDSGKSLRHKISKY